MNGTRLPGLFGVGLPGFSLPGGLGRWSPHFLLPVKRQKRVPFRTADPAPGPLAEAIEAFLLGEA